MPALLQWGYIPSCDLHYASVKDGSTRHDFLVQPFVRGFCVSPCDGIAHRLICLRSDSHREVYYEFYSLERARAKGEQIARDLVLDATYKERGQPVAIFPGVPGNTLDKMPADS